MAAKNSSALCTIVEQVKNIGKYAWMRFYQRKMDIPGWTESKARCVKIRLYARRLMLRGGCEARFFSLRKLIIAYCNISARYYQNHGVAEVRYLTRKI